MSRVRVRGLLLELQLLLLLGCTYARHRLCKWPISRCADHLRDMAMTTMTTTTA